MPIEDIAASGGVSVALGVAPDAPHVFVAFRMRDEADSAPDSAGRFLSAHLDIAAEAPA